MGVAHARFGDVKFGAAKTRTQARHQEPHELPQELALIHRAGDTRIFHYIERARLLCDAFAIVIRASGFRQREARLDGCERRNRKVLGESCGHQLPVGLSIMEMYALWVTALMRDCRARPVLEVVR